MKTQSKRGRGRRQVTHDEKRLEIIERCASLFDSGSYHRATMQMLADQVGLGKPTLYHYFRSKTDILYAIHQKHIDALIEGLDLQERQQTSPRERLVSAGRDILLEIAEHPGYVRAFFEHYGELEGAQRAEIRARRELYFTKICAIIRAGIGDGSFLGCDVQLTAYGFLGLCSWAYQWYPRIAGKAAPQEVAETLCGTLLRGLQRGT